MDAPYRIRPAVLTGAAGAGRASSGGLQRSVEEASFREALTSRMDLRAGGGRSPGAGWGT